MTINQATDEYVIDNTYFCAFPNCNNSETIEVTVAANASMEDEFEALDNAMIDLGWGLSEDQEYCPEHARYMDYNQDYDDDKEDYRFDKNDY